MPRNTKAYQWEHMDLEPGVRNLGTAVRGADLDHVAEWAPRGRTTRDCTWVASWAELGVTGTWPQIEKLQMDVQEIGPDPANRRLLEEARLFADIARRIGMVPQQ